MAVRTHLTAAECAQISGFSPKTIYRAIRSGALEASRPTAHYRVTPEALQRWLGSGRAAVLAVVASGPQVAAAPPEDGSLARLREIEDEAA